MKSLTRKEVEGLTTREIIDLLGFRLFGTGSDVMAVFEGDAVRFRGTTREIRDWLEFTGRIERPAPHTADSDAPPNG